MKYRKRLENRALTILFGRSTTIAVKTVSLDCNMHWDHRTTPGLGAWPVKGVASVLFYNRTLSVQREDLAADIRESNPILDDSRPTSRAAPNALVRMAKKRSDPL